MSRLRTCCLVILVACTELACTARERPPLPTVAGPEANDLVAATYGYVLTPHRATSNGFMSEIALMDLPSLVERDIQPPREGPYGFVASASGPDGQGRIAYVQQNGWGDSARLSIIDVDGANNRVIAAGVRAAGHVFGEHPALAPTGGAVALLVNVAEAWPHGEYIRRGTLTVWRPETNRADAIATDAIDAGFAWFPDGHRLVYVARVPRETIEGGDADQLTSGVPNCTGGAVREDSVPLIYIVDVRSGVRRPLHVGTNPVVSTDGSAVLLDLCGFVILVDNAGQHPREVTLPGNLHRPLAFLDGHVVVYWGLPTEGAPVVRSPYGSFGAGTQLVTIKIADLATGRFQTVIPAIDPRWDASFAHSASAPDTMPARHTLAPLH